MNKKTLVFGILAVLFISSAVYIIKVNVQKPTGLARGRVRTAIAERVSRTTTRETSTESAEPVRERLNGRIIERLSDLLGVDLDQAISDALEEEYDEEREGEGQNVHTTVEISEESLQRYLEQSEAIEEEIGDSTSSDYEIKVGSGRSFGLGELESLLEEILSSPSRIPYIPHDFNLEELRRPRYRRTLGSNREESNRPRRREMEMATGMPTNPHPDYYAPYSYWFITPITTVDLINEYNFVCRNRYKNPDGSSIDSAAFDEARIGVHKLLMSFMFTTYPEEKPMIDYFCADTFILMTPDYNCWTGPKTASFREIRDMFERNRWTINSMSSDSFTAEEIWDFFVTGYILYDLVRECKVYFPPRGGLKRGPLRRFTFSLNRNQSLDFVFHSVDVYYRVPPECGPDDFHDVTCDDSVFGQAARWIDGRQGADKDGLENGEISFSTFVVLNRLILRTGGIEIANYEITRTCELRNVFVPALTYILPNSAVPVDPSDPFAGTCYCDNLVAWWFDREMRSDHENYLKYIYWCDEHDLDECGY